MSTVTRSFVALILLSYCAQAYTQEKLHISLGDNYGKHAMVVKGKPAGIQKDLLDWFLIEHMKLDIEIEAMPWKRAQRMVELKMSDGYFTAYTKRRVEELKLVPSSRAFYTTQVKMHTWKGNPNIPLLSKLSSVDDLLALNDIKHIFIRGHGYHEEQLKSAKLVTRVSNALQVPRFLLYYKRADVFVEQSELFYPLAEDAKLLDRVATLDNIHFKSLNWHLFIRPGSKHVSLMKDVNRALEESIASGILYNKVREIFERYGLSYSE